VSNVHNVFIDRGHGMIRSRPRREATMRGSRKPNQFVDLAKTLVPRVNSVPAEGTNLIFGCVDLSTLRLSMFTQAGMTREICLLACLYSISACVCQTLCLCFVSFASYIFLSLHIRAIVYTYS
jgi:hypothetical protein